MPPLADVPIRSADELTTRWRTLLDPLEFAVRSLWLSWFGTDNRMLPIVIPVDGIPLAPEPEMLANLRQVHDSIVAEQLGGVGHLALALCRPGEPVVRGDDEGWVDALRAAMDGGSWSLHLAAGGEVTTLVEAPPWIWPR